MTDLFAASEPSIDAEFSSARRIRLDQTSWVEHLPGWLQGSGALFDELMDTAAWEQRYRFMWGRQLAEPRLTAGYRDIDDAPQQLLHAVVDALTRHYGVDYDPIGNVQLTSTVPVLSLGTARRFLIRPAEGGKSMPLTAAAGDLIVMGGRSQRDWRHAVPKQATPAGPRISVNFAPRVPAGRPSPSPGG